MHKNDKVFFSISGGKQHQLSDMSIDQMAEVIRTTADRTSGAWGGKSYLVRLWKGTQEVGEVRIADSLGQSKKEAKIARFLRDKIRPHILFVAVSMSSHPVVGEFDPAEGPHVVAGKMVEFVRRHIPSGEARLQLCHGSRELTTISINDDDVGGSVARVQRALKNPGWHLFPERKVGGGESYFHPAPIVA